MQLNKPAEENTEEQFEIPEIGFGTYGLEGDIAVQAVNDALELGYRHIDTASAYNNEQVVGQAIADTGLDREDFFISSKIWPSNFGPNLFPAAVNYSLELLKIEYVDLLMLHWGPAETEFLKVMDLLAAALETGQCKNIGVANFDARMIDKACKHIPNKIKINQIELHPYVDQTQTMKVTRGLDVAINGYCPLARGKVADDTILIEIADQLETSASAVTLRYLIDKGVSVVTTSSRRHHLEDNMEYKNIKLSDKHTSKIAKLVQPHGSVIDQDY